MKYSKSKWSFIVLLLATGLSCVKDPQDIPAGLQDDPVFQVRGSWNQQPLNIHAGDAEWTAVPKPVEKDSALIYSSVFSLNGCDVLCSPSWTFNFYRANNAANSGEADFLNTLATGPIDFVLSDQERDSFAITIATHPDLFMNGYSYWEDLNNPVTSFADSYTSTLGYNEDLNVCFQSYAFSGCQYAQCLFFHPSTLVPCVAYIQPQLESARHVSLTVKPEGTAPFQYEWANGENSPTVVVIIQDSVTAVYGNVTVTDANGNRASLAQTIRIVNGVVDACYFPITMESVPFTNGSSALAAGDLEVIHMDESGAEWRSTAGIQPVTSMATINQVDYYDLSPEGQPAYKVTLSIKVNLTNKETGETKLFDAQQITLPLSHP